MTVDDKTTVQQALDLIEACFDLAKLYPLAAKIATRFQGQRDLMAFFSERTVARLKELKEAELEVGPNGLAPIKHRGPIGFA